MSNKLPKYVNPITGDFTSIGLNKGFNSDEECFKIFEDLMEDNLYKSTYWKSLTDSEKADFHNYLRLQIKTGNMDPGFLLTLAMPPAMTPYKEFDEQDAKNNLQFDLPSKYKVLQKK